MIDDVFELSLLTKEEIASNESMLSVIKRYGPLSAITDNAVITGTIRKKSYDDSEFYHVPDDDTLKGVMGTYFTSTIQDDKFLSFFIQDEDNKIVFDATYDRSTCVRPVLYCPKLYDLLMKDRRTGYNGVKEVEFGEFPQYAPSLDIQRELEIDYQTGKLKKLAKNYTFDSVTTNEFSSLFTPVNYDVYEYEGKKYARIKVNSSYKGEFELSNGEKYKDGDYVWLEVSPITWFMDDKTKKLISKRCLLSGIPFFVFDRYYRSYEKSFIKKYLNKYMKYDMFCENNKIYKLLYLFGCDVIPTTNIDLVYYAFFSTFVREYYYKTRPNFNIIQKAISKMIMDDEIPNYILKYITTLSGWNSCFDYKVVNKISKFKNIKYYYNVEELYDSFEEEKKVRKRNIRPYIDAISNEKDVAILECNDIETIYKYNDFKDIIEFGEYPLEEANIFDSTILDILSINGLIDLTGKNYTEYIFLNEEKNREYILKGRKFIHRNNKWYRVLPLKWRIDLRNSILVLESDVSHLNRLRNENQLTTFRDEAITKCGYVNEKNISTNEKIKEMRELKEDESEKEELIQQLEDNIFEHIRAVKKDLEEINRITKKRKKPRFDLPREMILIDHEDYSEFNPKILDILQYINLSNIPSKDLKVTDIDFRGCNIYLDPQLVYNKDLSNSKFDDQNFILSRFDGCIMHGTDISGETDSFGYEEAYTDIKTKLPKNKRKKI